MSQGTELLRAGSWRLLRQLGEGGMGTVHEAVHQTDGRRAAIKVLRSDAGEQPGAIERMKREGQALAALDHPNVVPVWESGVLDDGRPFLVMPLVQGRPLRAAMRDRPLLPRQAWELLRPVALALDAAHRAGIVHRDVKPENVLVEDGRDGPNARLIDFGLARRLKSDELSRLTTTGVPLGTPQYMPPEQWWNEPIGPAADQYAFAAVMFEALAGRPPFVSDSYAGMLQAHLDAIPPTLQSLGISVPETLDRALQHALAKKAGARFGDMRQLVAAVDAALGFEAQRRRRLALAAPAVALVIPAAMVLAGYAGSHDPTWWSRLAGWGIWPVLGSFLVGIALLALGRPSIGLALFAGAFGTLGTATGMVNVVGALPGFELTQRFQVFNVGSFEANVNRFVAFLLGAALVVGSLALDALRSDTGRRRRSEMAATAVALGLLCASAWVLDARSAGLVALAAALVHGFAARSPTRNVELVAWMKRLLAVVLAAAGALARVDGRAAALWESDVTRAERAKLVMDAAAERDATLAVCLVSVAVTLIVGLAGWRRLPATALGPLSRGRIPALVFLAAWAAADVATMIRITSGRLQLWSELEPVFASFMKLDPPLADGLPAPQLAPSLRIARDVIGIDAQRVGLTSSLSATEGSTALAMSLSHRFAQEPTLLDAKVQMLVMADARVPWNVVTTALDVAHGLGLRRVQLLMTRGPSPQLPAHAPAEAAYALPGDFGAIDVELARIGGTVFNGGLPFAEVAPALIAMRQGGSPAPIVVRLGER